MIKAVIVVAALLSPAHDWYPSECCSGKDCDVVAASRVQVTSTGGYLLDGKWNIAASIARTSPDDNYHACIRHGVIVCFYAPRPST